MAVPLIIGAAILAAGVIGSVASGALSKQNVPGLPTPDESKFQDPGSKAFQDELARRMGTVDAREAPQAGGTWIMTGAHADGAQMDPATKAAILAQRKLMADQFMAAMKGEGPSLANMQLQKGLDDSLHAQQAAAASLRGKANTNLAIRSIGAQAGVAQQNAAGMSAMQRYQEQLQAQQSLAALTNSMHGQEMAEVGEANKIGLANAGFAQQASLANKEGYDQANLANLQAKLQAMGMNDAQIRAYLSMGAAQRQADREGAIDYEKTKMGQNNKQTELEMAAEADARRRKQAFWGSITGAGASMLGGGMGAVGGGGGGGGGK